MKMKRPRRSVPYVIKLNKEGVIGGGGGRRVLSQSLRAYGPGDCTLLNLFGNTNKKGMLRTVKC